MPEGGYAEGWNYLRNPSQTYLQLVPPHRRYSQGKAVPYRNPGTLTPEDPLVGQVNWYEDFSRNAVAREVFRMAIYSAAPNGVTVPTDDANFSALQ